MMQKKLVTIVAFLALVQLNKSAPIDVIASYAPQIQELQIRIGTVIRTSGQQIGLAQTTINRNVDAAQAAIAEQLDALKVIIAQAGAESASQSCADAASASLAELDEGAINQCRISQELDLLGLKLAELGRLKGQVGRLVRDCKIQAPVDEAALAECLKSGLESSAKQADDVESEILNTLEDADKNSAVCSDSVGARLGNAIEEIGQELKNCVSG